MKSQVLIIFIAVMLTICPMTDAAGENKISTKYFNDLNLYYFQFILLIIMVVLQSGQKRNFQEWKVLQ